MTDFKTDDEKLAYEIGRRDATKQWHESESAWVELNKQNVISHHQQIKEARADERAKVLKTVNSKIGNLMGWEEDPEYDRALTELRAKLEEMGVK